MLSRIALLSAMVAVGVGAVAIAQTAPAAPQAAPAAPQAAAPKGPSLVPARVMPRNSSTTDTCTNFMDNKRSGVVACVVAAELTDSGVAKAKAACSTPSYNTPAQRCAAAFKAKPEAADVRGPICLQIKFTKVGSGGDGAPQPTFNIFETEACPGGVPQEPAKPE